MLWSRSNAEKAAQTGASMGVKVGSKAGPLGAGVGAGLGAASGYIAGSLVPECPAKKVLPDGGRQVDDDGADGSQGTEIPVEES